jgi:Asp-tRNA(Asn)/Glu-tRNA(Gln) amidotransferase A subunit family amidase
MALQAALHRFEMAAVAMDAFFATHDAFLTPTLAKPPVALRVLALSRDAAEFGQEFNDFCPYASLANITGTPAMNLPLGQTRNGLPIGIMVQGGFAQEALLLRLAAQLEEAAPWAHRRPPIQEG